MPIQLTDEQRRLLDGKNFAYVGTTDESGAPQVTPVWIEFDGRFVLFNTEQKRAKVKHMQRDPRVAICVSNAENPYQYIELRGKVVEMTTDGADATIDRLAKKYLGQDKYPYNKPGDVRMTVKVEVEKVLGMRG